MSETSSSPPESSRALTWTLGILALLLGYGLSIGPLVYLAEKHIVPDPPPEWLGYLYMPVILLAEKTPLKEPFEAYVEWWATLAHRP